VAVAGKFAFNGKNYLNGPTPIEQCARSIYPTGSFSIFGQCCGIGLSQKFNRLQATQNHKKVIVGAAAGGSRPASGWTWTLPGRHPHHHAEVGQLQYCPRYQRRAALGGCLN
jgi:hypothetical protein